MKSKIKIPRFFSFQGRISRRHFWSFYIIYVILANAFVVFVSEVWFEITSYEQTFLRYVLPFLVAVFLVGAPTGMKVQRLHDTGKAAWWVLLECIPTLGSLALLIMLLFKGEPMANAYGEPPAPYKKKKKTQQEQQTTDSVQLEIPQSDQPDFAEDSRSVQIQMNLSEIFQEKANNTDELNIVKAKVKKNKIISIVLCVCLVASIIGNVALSVSLSNNKDDYLYYYNTTQNLRQLLIEKQNELDDKNTALKFYRRYAVRVVSGNSYFHYYNCEDADKDFYIYNRELAMEKGYKPCPKCYSKSEIAIYFS